MLNIFDKWENGCLPHPLQMGYDWHILQPIVGLLLVYMIIKGKYRITIYGNSIILNKISTTTH